MPDWLEAREGALELHLKVVPGGARTAVVGALGDRLKIKVAAPPEGGKANRAVLALLAASLDVPVASLTITRGVTSPRKTVALPRRLDPATVRRRLT